MLVFLSILNDEINSLANNMLHHAMPLDVCVLDTAEPCR